MALTPTLSLLGFTVSIVLLHTTLQERFRNLNRPVADEGLEHPLPHIWGERPPSVDVVVPTYNEHPDVLAECLASLARQDYKGPMRFLVVDDGSANLDELLPVYKSYLERPDWTVLLRRGGPPGKRHAQQAAICGAGPRTMARLGVTSGTSWEGSNAEFVMTVDSDTVVAPDGISWILTPFLDDEVAAVTGDVGILNRTTNRLTKLIADRYELLFGHERAAQSYFGKVFCCAGPFSAYRRRHLDEIWDDYMRRRFLRARCTFGDDIQLTNLMLEKGHRSIYQQQAKALTTAPTTLRAYLRQQWRWNRSSYRQFRWILRVLFRERRYQAGPYLPFDLAARVAPPLLLVAALAAIVPSLVTLETQRLVEDLLALAGTAVAWLSAVALQTRKVGFTLLYGLMFITLLLPVRLWALCTLRDSQWGTRTSAGGDVNDDERAIGAVRRGLAELVSP
jgi:cellulose synthase/poly-beta-1,6-N-acetylglucosamine synthase-like glycosyltransferase